MKAFVLPAYGSADVLELTDLEVPAPGEGEVLVRVRATSVNPADWHIMRGEPRVARLMGGAIGLRRPGLRVLGFDVAGEVAAVGPGVEAFAPGDEVFGLVNGGGFGEYVCAPAGRFARKPANLSFEQAAAVPLAACTALIAVRDVEPGQRVLVNGASGGVGTFAVQLARAFGAEVTGVCRTRNVEMVRSIGASEAIDYTTTDFTRTGRRYDLLVDIAGSRTLLACRRVIARGGRYVVVGGTAGKWMQPAGHMFASLALSPFVRAKIARADVVASGRTREDLALLAELASAGELTPVIDRTYPFADTPAAVRYQEEGHCPGKVVVAF